MLSNSLPKPAVSLKMLFLNKYDRKKSPKMSGNIYGYLKCYVQGIKVVCG